MCLIYDFGLFELAGLNAWNSLVVAQSSLLRIDCSHCSIVVIVRRKLQPLPSSSAPWYHTMDSLAYLCIISSTAGESHNQVSQDALQDLERQIREEQ